jgi:hypothetical protein
MVLPYLARKSNGNPTTLETESSTLPHGRFNMPDLWTALLPTPPVLSSLRRATGADCRIWFLNITDIEARIRFRSVERMKV